eukprot:8586064-Pyramimonas_sp.AAC.1
MCSWIFLSCQRWTPCARRSRKSRGATWRSEKKVLESVTISWADDMDHPIRRSDIQTAARGPLTLAQLSARDI